MPFDPHTGESPAPGQRYSLRALVKASNPGIRRKEIAFRPIQPPQALASDLFAVAYKPLVTAMQEAIPAIVAAYEAGLPIRDGLVRDSTDQAQQQTETLGQQLQRIALTLLPGLRGWAMRSEAWHRGQFRGAALSATGVDVGTLLMASGTPTSVEQTISWNTSLIKDVGQQAVQKMQSAIFAAFQARKPARDLAKELQDITGFARARSLRIASDQTTKLSSALDRERAVEAGITEYNWRWSHKRHGRPEHIARDGKVFRYSEPPHDGPPGTLPFCGCRAAARLVF